MYTLAEWSSTSPAPFKIEQEVVDKLVDMVQQVRAYCELHNIPMTFLANTGHDVDTVFHYSNSFVGHSEERGTPEILLCSVLGDRGVDGGSDFLAAIYDAIPLRYTVPHLKEVK